ncbi:50S ribosomal protein L11 methyltransferase, partial [Acinetobacter baumannii]
EKQQFDVVLANINNHIILDNQVFLAQNVVIGGTLLLSGLLQEDENEVVNGFVQRGFLHQKTIDLKGWIAIKLSY